MLLSKSSNVCIPIIRSIAPRVCLAQEPFLAIFVLNVNTGRGVVI